MNVRLPSFKQIIRYLIVAGMLIIAFSAFLFVYWSVSDVTVLEIKNNPLPVRTIRQHPTADGVVILHAEYCKNSNIQGRLTYEFVGKSAELLLPVARENLPTGCEDGEFPILIPKNIKPGVYKVKFRVEYQVNPIKRVTQEFTSQPFEVVGG